AADGRRHAGGHEVRRDRRRPRGPEAAPVGARARIGPVGRQVPRGVGARAGPPCARGVGGDARVRVRDALAQPRHPRVSAVDRRRAHPPALAGGPRRRDRAARVGRRGADRARSPVGPQPRRGRRPVTVAAASTDLVELRNRYYYDVERFVHEIFRFPNEQEQKEGKDIYPWQRQAMRWYDARERRISIKSGHGVGKTTFLAWLMWHQELIRFPQKTAVTAPTEKQLFNALWSEFKSWGERMP